MVFLKVAAYVVGIAAVGIKLFKYHDDMPIAVIPPLNDVDAAARSPSRCVRENNFFNGRLTKLFFLVRTDLFI